MSEQLKPCPFCGGEAALLCTDNGWLVQCWQCWAYMGTSGLGFDTSEKAVEAWNRRVGDDEPSIAA